MRRAIYSVFVILSMAFLATCSTESTPVYTLSVTADPAEAGSVTPVQGEYEEAEQVEISATANEHWVFTGWQGDLSGNTNPALVTIDRDLQIRALFTKQEYPLTVETIGEGTVEEEVVEQKTTDYPHGTTVELTALPADGWVFTRWEGDAGSEENPLVITVNEETTITAVFIKRQYPLTITITGEGEVDEQVVQAKSTDYPAGTQVELTAIPAENWIFSGWSGDLEGQENPAVIDVDGPTEINAEFVRTFRLLAIAEPEQGGRVEPSDSVLASGSDIEVEAVANPGWRFTRWQGDSTSEENPLSLTMNGNKTLVASFERVDYLLTTSTQGEGSVTEQVVQAKSSEYPFETVVELTAEPAEGWVFTGWQGDLEGSENPQTLTMDGEKEITAVFERDFFDVTVSTQGEGSTDLALVSGLEDQGRYEYESELTVTATPAEEWVFAGWQGDIETAENPATITVDGDVEITAVFAKQEYPLMITITGEGTVDEQVIQSKTDYPSGTQVELTATPDENWTFSEWSGDLDSEENPITITIDEPQEVTATFLRFYTLTTNVSPGEGGTVTPGSGGYVQDTTIEVEATASEGWEFVEWEGDFSGSVNPFNLTMNGDKTITANYERKEFEVEINTVGDGNVSKKLVSGLETEQGYLFESKIELTATANGHWKFLRWEGDFESDNNPAILEVEKDMSISAVFTEFPGGDGSIDDPYHVANLEQLQRVGKYLDSHFVQIADINAESTNGYNPIFEFKPIGTWINEDENDPFMGTYDGNDFIIQNLEINNDDGFAGASVGLFGYMNGGVIKNLHLLIKNMTNDYWSSDSDYTNVTIGGIVGYNRGTIKNVRVEGEIGISNAGGVAGINDGEIINAKVSRLRFQEDGGGIAAINNGNISESSFIGDISGFGLSGGIARYNNGRIEESYTLGQISAIGSNGGTAGGIAGENEGEIINSYAIGLGSGEGVGGGLVGWNKEEGIIKFSYAVFYTNEMSKNFDCYLGGCRGGLIGENDGAVISGYWDEEAGYDRYNAGVDTGNSDGVFGLTTEEMTGESAIDNMPDFDWETIWKTTEEYPIFQWQDE